MLETIPIFPEFRKMQLEDREVVENFVNQYKPYSDYNFVSLWSWDAQGGIMCSKLNENLVIRMSDYITNEIFHSFLGENQVDNTIQELLNLQDEMGLGSSLKLIPGVVVSKIKEMDRYQILEDEDNFDYVYLLDKLMTYDGNKMRSKRNLVNRFNKTYDKGRVKVLDLNPDFGNEDAKQIIESLVKRWVDHGANDKNDNEIIAIERLFKLKDKKRLVFPVIFIDDKPTGFAINEVLPNGFSLLHFEKADREHVGIYAYLMQQNAFFLKKKGSKYLNYEQDLGLPGLRLGKRSYKPCDYLKKYTISLKQAVDIKNL